MINGLIRLELKLYLIVNVKMLIKTLIRNCLVTVLLTTPCVHAEWDEWFSDADLSFTGEDNINRALFGSEERNDQYWGGSVLVGRLYHLSGFTRFDLSTRIKGRVHHEFSKLNQVNAGFQLGVRHKFGLGPAQPWIRSYVDSGYIFSRSEIRNGFLTHAGVRFGQPINNRISVEIGYEFDYRESDDGKPIPGARLIQTGLSPNLSNSVFDLMGHSANAQLKLALTEQILLNLGYTFRAGDIVSVNNAGQASEIARIVDAVVNDDAFPGWAYRADGLTNVYSATAGYALLDGQALVNVQYQHIATHARSWSYRNNVFRINFNYRF